MLVVATYSSCGGVADGREEDDVMVIMVEATGGICGSVALMWMLKLYIREGTISESSIFFYLATFFF